MFKMEILFLLNLVECESKKQRPVNRQGKNKKNLWMTLGNQWISNQWGSAMIRKLLAVSVILLATVSFSLAGSKPNVKPGKWQVTTRMEMPGMQMNMPPMTHIQCITEDDYVPQTSQPGEECKITQTRVSGDTVTWTMHCRGEGGEMKGNGKVTYRGDSFEGKISMSMAPSGMSMTIHTNGRRIGDCD